MPLCLGMKHGDKIRLTTAGGTVIWLQLTFGPISHPRMHISAPDTVVIEREKIIGRTTAGPSRNGGEAPGMGAG